MAQPPLKIAVIDANPIRAAILIDGLRDAGCEDVHHITDMHGLLARLTVLEPDVILIDLENPSRDVLEQMFQVSRAVPRPIAMFVDQSDTASIEAAIDAGVSAYIVDGLKRERIRPIVDMTISRFNAFARLKAELEEARTQLAERKLVDRAKALLMERRGISEEEAYRLLRSAAMQNRQRIAEVAQSLLTAANLLSPESKKS